MSEESQSGSEGLDEPNSKSNGSGGAALVPAGRGKWEPALRTTNAAGPLQPLDPFADDGDSTLRRAPATGGGLSLASFLRFKWTILGTTVLVAGGAIPAIWCLIIPEYRARATVEVLPSNPRILYRTEDNSIPYHQQYLNSQPSVIRGVTVLKRVLELPAVQQTSWYAEPKKTLLGKPVSRLEALKDSLLAEPRPGTYLIDVSMRARDPHDAEVIANELVEQYLAFAREKSQETNDAVYQRLLESKRTLEAEMETRKAVTSELQRQLGAATSADVVPRSKTWLEDRQVKLDELRREIATSEWQEHELVALLEPEAKTDTNTTNQPTAIGPRYADDADWRRLHVELKTVRHEIQANPQQLGDGHPDRIALVKKAELLEDLLKEQQDRLDEQFRVFGGKPPSVTGTVSSPANELAALRRKIGLLKKQEELLVADIQRREGEYERTFNSAKVLDKENDALRYEAEKFDLVRRRIDEKETEGSMFVSVRSVATAFAPSVPDQDRRLLLTAAVLFAAFLSGFGAAYVRLCTSPAVREMSDLSTTSPPPFLGDLPLLRRPIQPDTREAAMQSECIRMVRTALLQRLNGSFGSPVIITSAGPGVGKTTLTGLLARSLAQLGKKVLAVDADVRKPALCRSLGIIAGAGLIDLLRSEEAPVGGGAVRVWDADVIVPCDPAGFDVMPAGRVVHGRDAELLGTAAFAACLERWRKCYDVVLLDSPPVLPVADARILARQAAGTIMVVREGHCRRTEVVDALASLGMAGAKMLGTVFIGSSRMNGYRHGYCDYALPSGVGGDTLDVRER